MKEIQLTQQGKNKGLLVALVDDDDYESLSKFRWVGHKERSGIHYALRTVKKPVRKTIYMHRVIMNTPLELCVDHIDHNGLNNQKSNLRNCTRSQNQANRKPSGRSKYLGVCLADNRIRAMITVNSKCLKIGSYKTEEAAAHAYDEAAKKYHGEFANLNFKQEELPDKSSYVIK